MFSVSFQVDYLQQTNRELEKQLNEAAQVQSEATSLIKNLKQRNDELCTELAAINKMCKRLEKEKNKGDTELGQQIKGLKNDLHGQSDIITELKSNKVKLKKVREVVKGQQ